MDSGQILVPGLSRAALDAFIQRVQQRAVEHDARGVDDFRADGEAFVAAVLAEADGRGDAFRESEAASIERTTDRDFDNNGRDASAASGNCCSELRQWLDAVALAGDVACRGSGTGRTTTAATSVDGFIAEVERQLRGAVTGAVDDERPAAEHVGVGGGGGGGSDGGGRNESEVLFRADDEFHSSDDGGGGGVEVLYRADDFDDHCDDDDDDESQDDDGSGGGGGGAAVFDMDGGGSNVRRLCLVWMLVTCVV